jgi:hypothetical protein
LGFESGLKGVQRDSLSCENNLMPFEVKYSEFERILFQNLVERHTEHNNFNDSYLQHIVDECKNGERDISDLVYQRGGSGHPAKTMRLQSSLDKQKIAQRVADEKCNKMLECFCTLFNVCQDYDSRARDAFFKEELDEMKGDENDRIRKECLFLLVHLNYDTIRGYTKSIIDDYVRQKDSLVDVRRIKSFELMLGTGIKSCEPFVLWSKAITCLNETPHVVATILGKLHEILTGEQNLGMGWHKAILREMEANIITSFENCRKNGLLLPSDSIDSKK